jgi:hypothetical protein
MGKILTPQVMGLWDWEICRWIGIQIQDEIENAGGITNKEIDTLIAAYCQKKRARGK